MAETFAKYSADGTSTDKRKIAIAIIGQSNERGQVSISDASTYKQAFVSKYKPSLRYPAGGIVTRNGGPWYAMYDALYEAGYDAHIINAAKGSASIIKDYAGQVQFRSNSAQYSQQRDQLGKRDYGYFGDTIVMSGKVFRCTTGNKKYIQYEGNQRIPNTNVAYLDYVLQDGVLASAAADPATWAAATLGSTVVDGGITWTCIDDTNSVGYSGGQVFAEAQIGYGFDPFGLLLDVMQELQDVQGVEQKLLIICNAQSDTSATSAWYQNALTNIANYVSVRGIKVLLGMSMYNSNGGIDRTTAYNTLQTGLNAAIASFPTDPWVYPGANLYNLMGITGPMSWAQAGQPGSYMQSDGIHVNGNGAIVMGNLWASYVIKALENRKS